MNETDTTIYALTVALAAILAPAITAFFQYIVAIRKERFAASYSLKISIFTRIIELYKHNSFSKYEAESRNDIYKASIKASTYCIHSKIRRCLFKFADEVLTNGRTPKADKLFAKCVRLMRKEV